MKIARSGPTGSGQYTRTEVEPGLGFRVRVGAPLVGALPGRSAAVNGGHPQGVPLPEAENHGRCSAAVYQSKLTALAEDVAGSVEKIHVR